MEARIDIDTFTGTVAALTPVVRNSREFRVAAMPPLGVIVCLCICFVRQVSKFRVQKHRQSAARVGSMHGVHVLVNSDSLNHAVAACPPAHTHTRTQ